MQRQYNKRQSNHIKATLKKYVLKDDLKTLRDSFLISEGREFHNLGANEEKAWSHIVLAELFEQLEDQLQKSIEHMKEGRGSKALTNIEDPNYSRPYKWAWEF